jgi:hypothetical protein
LSCLPHRIALLALAATVLLTGSGCELTEVTAAGGNDVLVVEAVLRADAVSQEVLLHRTLDGKVVGGAPGARVSVVTSEGREIRFAEDPAGTCVGIAGLSLEQMDSLQIQATCYVAPPLERSWVVPGGSYELHVQTADGRQVRGRTQVPGEFQLRSPSSPAEEAHNVYCTLPPGQPFTLVWSSSPGAWVYLSDVEIFGLRRALAGLEIKEVPDPLRLTGLSISEADTTLVLPTQFGVFERTEYDPALLRALQNGFPDGVSARVVVAALDRNFVNALRGGSFNPSGNVRISSVMGDGVGVFGSFVPLTLVVDVRYDNAGTRCNTIGTLAPPLP